MSERNKTKRTLELIGAVFAIILGSILFLGAVIMLTSKDLLVQMLQQEGTDPSEAQLLASSMNTAMFFVLLLSIAIVVLAAFCCPKRKVYPNGTIQKRFGIHLTLVIILGLLAVTEMIGKSLLGALLSVVPFILFLVSLCLRGDDRQISTQARDSFEQQQTTHLEMYGSNNNDYSNEQNSESSDSNEENK